MRSLTVYGKSAFELAALESMCFARKTRTGTDGFARSFIGLSMSEWAVGMVEQQLPPRKSARMCGRGISGGGRSRGRAARLGPLTARL
jgi:hypothetical protein